MIAAAQDGEIEPSAVRQPGGRPREKCGVCAVYNYQGPGNAALVTYLGLLALQHRGQESAGMAYLDSRGLQSLKGMGLVENVFPRQTLAAISAASVIGHVRYSTTGTSTIANAQPLVARSYDGSGIALAHNGNLVNTAILREKLLDEGHIFHANSDSEIILTYLFRFRRAGLAAAIKKTMGLIKGAYAVVVTDGERVAAFRDPEGFRPLVIGKLGDSFLFASETAAFDTLGASFLREVDPGEIVTAGPEGLSSIKGAKGAGSSFCVFEYVYFARPDSVIDGMNVHQVRKAVGALMAKRVSCRPDMIVPSPDSGVSAAMGLAEALNTPMEWAVYRNSYLGRTFIEPTQGEREMAVRLKFNPVRELVQDKKIALVDDSLVRGTTARVLTRLLRACGAAEIHLLIASPPYRNPCYYGIDIPVSADLASFNTDLEKLAADVGADSVIFATPADLFDALDRRGDQLCGACFSGIYPSPGEIKGRVS